MDFPPDREPASVEAEKNLTNMMNTLASSITDVIIGLKGKLYSWILPSVSILGSTEHNQYLVRRDNLKAEIEIEISECRALLGEARKYRHRRMKAARQGFETSTKPLDNKILKECCKSIKQTRLLKRHLEALEKDLQNVEFAAVTQAALDHSGYHGIVDWAHRTLDVHKYLIEALSQVSFVGAGLTYSTIFSATRGNLGLMCYAFALFNCGFILPLAMLALLRWATHRPRTTPFPSPHIWSGLLNFFVYVALIAVGGAICILNATIILLRFEGGNDSMPQLDITPRPAGYVALVSAGITGTITLFALVLHYAANGWNTLLDALFSRCKQETKGKHFDHYVCQ